MKKEFVGLLSVCGTILFSSIGVHGQNAHSSSMTPQNVVNRDTLSDTSLVKLTKIEEIDTNLVTGQFTSDIQFSKLQVPSIGSISSKKFPKEVRKQVDKYTESYYSSNSKHLSSIQAKSGPYFSVMSQVFNQYNLPQDLRYLAVIESDLNTGARSHAGAVGLWQFMAPTARLFGLRVNARMDERKDIRKSTVAAAKYLSELYKTFDDWMLVLAAYNSGPVKVQNAIKSVGSQSFWDIKSKLPQESQKHVMKFLATSSIMKGFANFFGADGKDIQLGLVENSYKDLPYDKSTLATIGISGKYSLPVIAEYISMDLMVLEKINPGISQRLINDPNRKHYLFLPADKMILFKKYQHKIQEDSNRLSSENKDLS